MKRNILHIVLLFAALLVVNNVWGASLPTSGYLVNNTYTLTDNITLNNTLTVPAGVNAIINLNGKTLNGNSKQIFVVNGTLTINGGGIITGGKAGNGGCAIISGTLNLNGVTIQNCTATTDGGAFYVQGTGKLTITNGILQNNSAERHGGAICSANVTNVLKIKGNTQLKYNKAKNSGGAIYARTLNIQGNNITDPVVIEYNEATTLGTADPTFTPNYDKNNKITGYSHNSIGQGGGIFIPTVSNNSDPFTEMKCEIEFCKIQYNHASVNGGGIFSGVHSTVKNSMILYNTAMASEKQNYSTSVNSGRGGGFYFTGYYKAAKDGNPEINKPTVCLLENTEVSNNAAMYYGGGGQLGTRARLEFKNSKINSNTAVLHGAGGLHLTSNVTLNFESGEINNNKAYTVGGGIHTSYGCTLNLNGGIIQGNVAYQRGGGVHVNTGGNLVLNGTNIISNEVYKGKDMAYATVVRNTDGSYTWDKNSLAHKTASLSSYKYEDNDDSKYLVNTGLGGGILIDSGTCTMNKGELSKNSAEAAGGGLCLVMIRLSDKVSDFETLNVVQFTMKAGSIKNNATNGNGAGVYIMRNKILTMLQELSQSAQTEIKNSSKYNELTTGKPSTIIETGSLENNIANLSGGAIYMEEGNFTVNENVTLSKNKAKTLDGGAIYIGDGNVIVKETGIVTANGNNATNGNGGGIYCKGAFAIKGTATISGNSARNGGGICVENGNVTIAKDKRSEIKNNIATMYGGGLYVVNNNSTETTASFNGGTFFQNKAQAGGAVSAIGKMNLGFSADLKNNIAENGGGIYIAEGVNMTFNGGLIVGNQAITSNTTALKTAYYTDIEDVYGVGGGIFMADKTTLEFSDDVITNKFLGIYDNVATYAAADIYASGKMTEITNLPNTNLLDRTGYKTRATSLYWAEDYVTDDNQYATYGINKDATKGGNRYQTVLVNEPKKISWLKYEDTESSKKITDYACLDLGYDIVFITLTAVGLDTGEYAEIQISNLKYNTTNEKEPYIKVLFSGIGNENISKIIGLPSGKWNFTATKFMHHIFNDPSFNPDNEFIEIESDKFNGEVHNSYERPEIKVTFTKLADTNKKNAIETYKRVVNYMK